MLILQSSWFYFGHWAVTARKIKSFRTFYAMQNYFNELLNWMSGSNTIMLNLTIQYLHIIILIKGYLYSGSQNP